MFQVIHLRHRWHNSTEIESEVTYNGEVIVISILNIENGTIRLTSGGFDALEENPEFQEREGKTHLQSWTDVVKNHATSWADRNPQM